ncbi:hypothetical protein STEG23_009910, partial [Scotinomys teguina]
TYYVYNILSACTPAHQKRGLDLIKDGCEPSYGCQELNSGHLEEQPVLLTSEPSLQPYDLTFQYYLFLSGRYYFRVQLGYLLIAYKDNKMAVSTSSALTGKQPTINASLIVFNTDSTALIRLSSKVDTIKHGINSPLTPILQLTANASLILKGSSISLLLWRTGCICLSEDSEDVQNKSTPSLPENSTTRPSVTTPAIEAVTNPNNLTAGTPAKGELVPRASKYLPSANGIDFIPGKVKRKKCAMDKRILLTAT